MKVSLFPLHNEDARHRLIQKWHATPLYAIPFESIHAYFGPELSMYFVWLGTSSYYLSLVLSILFDISKYYLKIIYIYIRVGVDFYTRFLIIPSVCGVALFAMEYCGVATSAYMWPYTIVFSISTSVFVDAWKKTQRATEFNLQYMPIEDTYAEP
ncbi:hypothetical protein AaE_007503, partial [Aphanomyces astaci]